ncbi:hypothetical protein AB0B92_23405, partial [Streptomyces hygroscopicus]
ETCLPSASGRVKAGAGPPSPGGAGGGMSAGGPEGGPPEDNTYGSTDPAGEEAALGGLLG